MITSRNTVLERIASLRNPIVLVVFRTRSVASRYTPKHTEAASAMASPEPSLTWRSKSSRTITREPVIANASPSQYVRLGGRRRTSQVSRPTKMGVLLPRIVAFAAEVSRIEVL